MQAQANKHVAEPGDILVVVTQSVILVPLEIWIVVSTHLTIDLNAHQKDGRTQDLNEEYDQFDADPNFGVADPEVFI